MVVDELEFVGYEILSDRFMIDRKMARPCDREALARPKAVRIEIIAVDEGLVRAIRLVALAAGNDDGGALDVESIARCEQCAQDAGRIREVLENVRGDERTIKAPGKFVKGQPIRIRVVEPRVEFRGGASCRPGAC